MNKIYITLFILKISGIFLPGYNYSQIIYSCDSKYDADLIIYVADNKYNADLIVFKLDSKYEVRDNKGLWYFTQNKYEANKLIWFTENKYEADLIIYFTRNKYEANWRKREKMYLLY